MPQPPPQNPHLDAVQSSLESILGALSEERAAAADRHKEILVSLSAQQDAFYQQLQQLRDAPVSHWQCPLETNGTDGKSNVDMNASTIDVPDLNGIGSDPARLTELAQQGSAAKHKKLAKGSRLNFGERQLADEENTMLARARRFVLHDRFEISIAVLIFVNALLMCLDMQRTGLMAGCALEYEPCTNRELNNTWPGASDAFLVLDYIFGGLFIAEAVLKITIFRTSYFCDKWNLVDLLCVIVFLADKLAKSYLGVVDSQSLRMLRLLRLVRLMQLLRTLESLDSLYIMTTAITDMSLIVVWAMGLLTVMLMACSLFLSQYLHATNYHDEKRSDLTQAEADAYHRMFEYFGTFTKCLFTMFEMTLANWPPAARLLISEVSEWFTPICLIHKLTIGFAVVGVINGVVLQVTFKAAQHDDFIMVRQKMREAQALKGKMQLLFEALDITEDGGITLNEFEVISEHPDVKFWLASMDFETSDLYTLFNLIDDDGNGSISPEELLTRMPLIKGLARSFDMLALRRDVKWLMTHLDALALPGKPDMVEAQSPNSSPTGRSGVQPQW